MQLVFELSHDFSVGVVVQWMVARILAEIEPVCEFCHLPVDVGVFDSDAKAVRVCEQELALGKVRLPIVINLRPCDVWRAPGS